MGDVDDGAKSKVLDRKSYECRCGDGALQKVGSNSRLSFSCSVSDGVSFDRVHTMRMSEEDVLRRSRLALLLLVSTCQ